MRKKICYNCPYWRGHNLEAMVAWCDKLLQITAYDDWCYEEVVKNDEDNNQVEGF